MTIYDHVFTPFRIADGRCTVAPESEWQAAAKATGRVLVDADLFQEWDGPIHNESGQEVYTSIWSWMFSHDPAKFSDVTRRVFAMIDATPRTTWIVRTERPENVERLMPPLRVRSARDMSALALEYGADYEEIARPNLWLGVTARTQAELDERLPKLLSIPAAKRFVDLAPSERIDLAISRMKTVPPIDWVTVRGDADPLHPAWARGPRDQATSAGVPFAFTGWGEWVEVGKPTDADEVARMFMGFNSSERWLNTAGGNKHDGWETIAVTRVGRERSGRQLDGREWSEVPA